MFSSKFEVVFDFEKNFYIWRCDIFFKNWEFEKMFVLVQLFSEFGYTKGLTRQGAHSTMTGGGNGACRTRHLGHIVYRV